MLDFVAFYLFSALILAMFAIVVMSSNILYAMSALASGMIFISGIFFSLGAEFIGVVQIAVYTGAVMALYAFGMMFFDMSREVSEEVRRAKTIGILSVGIALMLVIIVSMPRILSIAQYKIEAINDIEIAGNVEQIGIVLFTKYLLPFEIAAVMLLIALVAGIALVVRENPADSVKDSATDSAKDSTNATDSANLTSGDFSERFHADSAIAQKEGK